MKVIYMSDTITLMHAQGIDTTQIIEESPIIKTYDDKPYLVITE